MTLESPYPGLRPFHRDEAHLFFGREEQTDELLRRLDHTRFLAVVGPSGCGKSSLVRAGMIAALETGFMVGAGSRWEFAVMRPGSHPIRRLATALIENTSVAPRDAADAADALGFLTASLRRGPLGLVEALQITPLPPGTNLLILVDQFEELFRFRREGGGDEADAFVSLLLETARQRKVPVYTVITMRSDFFGDCAVFAGLPEAINESQFLTPRLSREQREAAIVGPARVYGGDVEPMLVNRLLNEMGSDPDQLPVMQHLLMRMWTYRAPGRTTAAEEQNIAPASRVLTLHDYEQVGGLRHALSNHADEAYGSLSKKQKKITELMFRRLSERGEDQRDIRRPTRCGEIASLCDTAIDQVVAVVDVFRAPGVSFLVPAWPEPIGPTNVLDISHESLIRQWSRLKEWAREEGQSAETYRFLEQTARRWRDGQAALWGTPNLELALDWKARERPTAGWAERYGGDFAAALAFLEASEAARRESEAEATARQLRQVWRLRAAAASLAIALVGFAGSAVFYLYGWVWPHEAYYNTMIKRWGKPEGYGKLSADQVGRRPVSLKFIRNNGWFGEVDRVEAIDRHGECTHNHSIGTYLEYAPEVPSPMRECAWEFIHGHDGQVVYEKAYNKFDELVWGFAYGPAVESAAVRRAYFVGPDGFPQPRKNSKAEIVEFEYDRTSGNEVKVTYWDRSRRAQPALDRAYGQKIEYYGHGLPRQIMSLDAGGQPMNDTYGNAYLVILQYDSLGNTVEAVALDKIKEPVRVTLGFHKYVAKYDEDGNAVAHSFFGTDGLPTSNQEGFHQVTNEYDARGNMISGAVFDTSGRPMLLREGYHRWIGEYDERGNRVVESYFDVDGRLTVHSDGYHRWAGEYDERGNVIAGAYFGVDDQPALHPDGYHRWTNEYDERGHQISAAYFDREGEPAVLAAGYHRWTNEYDEKGNRVAGAYFDSEGRPVALADGYHRWTNEYDDRGNLVAGGYFDTKGRPAVHSSGYHRWINEHDDRGNAIAATHFDVEDRPTEHVDGYHRLTIEYDDRGNRTAEAYFDGEGRPTEHADGYHRLTMEYDDRDNRTAEAYFDSERRPTEHVDGHHRWTAEYDAQDKRVAEAYFDIEGTHRIYEYDDQGNRVAESYFDNQGSPAKHPDGYHRLTAKYDQSGNRVADAYFDIDGQPALHADGYHRVAGDYDERGSVTALVFFDANGSPTEHRDGYHRWTAEYDDQGNRVAEAYFDIEGAHRIYKYDDQGNRVAESYFDNQGRAAKHPNGYHRWTAEYDDQGNRIAEAYVDIDGYYGVYRYDERGNMVTSAHFDAEDRPTAHPDGYHSVSITYDDAGNQVDRTYRDKTGNVLDLMTKVIEVVSDSQADSLGLKAGDFILEYNGRDIDSVSEFVHETASEGRSQRELVIWRDSQILTFQVEPGLLGVEVSDVLPPLDEKLELLPAAE